MKSKRVLLTLIFLFLLTGCGTATTIDTSTSVKITALHVMRPATLNNVPTFERTIQDRAAIQHLFQTAYTLPAAPTGRINCPNDLGIVYHLTFIQGTTTLQQMTLDASGCTFLRIGQNSSDLRYADYNFQQLTAETIGLPSLVPPIR